MSMSRRMKRNKPKRPLTEMVGFDLRKLEMTDVQTVEMDATEHTVTVTFAIPVDHGETMAEYEQTFDVEETPEVSAAATALSRALVKTAQAQSLKMREADPPCVTCTSKCCGRHFGSVPVTALDLDRMKEGGIDVSDQTVTLYKHELFSGHVGEFKLVPYTGPSDDEDEKCCPHLVSGSCSIYELRPRTCREYSAWTCDIYEEDKDKMHLKVVSNDT